MSDLIDRQAAIDALKGLPTWWADSGGYYGGAQPPMEALLEPEDAISALENLPSAQPEERALHESCTDCPLYDKDRHSCPRFNKVIPETLRELQSAQPERETAKFIRWMECKKTANYISYTPHCKCSKCGTEFLIETIKYCYMCGARMER